MRLGKNISYSGPSVTKFLSEIEKKNLELVKPAVRESALILRRQAKEDAPVLTGNYRKSIRFRVRILRRQKEVQAKVGVRLGDPVMRYAGKIESKYFIFTRLEKTQELPVRSKFRNSIIKTINRMRVK